MPLARSVLVPLAAILILGPTPVLAEDGPVCAPVTKLPLERYLRQLSLDLLGRPPTVEEYTAVRTKGEVSVEDVRSMMNSEQFYTRMRGYHRALLWSNVNGSVNNNTNSRLYGKGDATDALSMRGNSSVSLRGANGIGCDSYIPQDSCATALRQDPHAEPTTTKACYDARGVPLPVSWDYDTTSYYQCSRLDLVPNADPTKEPVPDPAINSCDAATKKTVGDRLDPKYMYFCDMRRVGTALVPHLCKPHPTKASTSALTAEETDGSGKVVAFKNPNPSDSTTLTRLDRCTLTMSPRNGVEGTYVPQRGCFQREGYVTRPAPFWNLGGPEVRICAIEAQERSVNPWTLESCTTARFNNDRSCGCGEKMRRCEDSATSTTAAVTHPFRVAAINTEPELIADSVLRNDEPYFNILTTRRSFVNGPLSELYRDPQQGVGVFSLSSPAPAESMPVLPFADANTWREYVRGPQHSGVLTTPAWLYRFPTQRARVNHFYSAFLCKAFVPSNNRPPAAEDACNRDNNLSTRCACKDCHATIEPTGAHWGRFAERAALYLEPSRFPRFDPKCYDCAIAGNTSCNGECSQYVMQAYDEEGARSLGTLTSFLYRNASEEQNIEGGPQLLVQRLLQGGDLERCAVRRIWEEFLGRPMSGQEQALYLEQFAADFAADNHRLKGLIERLLLSDAYRRID
ncbi:DUF1585 domain-containing protein [Cystobacter fuscus]|uniref:DUF1585 domain-containing protein n=1 Tax=Cystobacter fuscus TaxID=43 RepID=UPI002B2C44AF|nr:DUF1585 domain-containing protein [Cystobacter fuscus]